MLPDSLLEAIDVLLLAAAASEIKQDAATLRSKAPRRRRDRHASTWQAHRHRYRPLGHTNPAASKLSIPKVEKSDVAIFDPIDSFDPINHNGECRGRDPMWRGVDKVEISGRDRVYGVDSASQLQFTFYSDICRRIDP